MFVAANRSVPGQVELVQIICACLRDPLVQVSAAALSLASRLTARNPSVIVPTLRRVLMQLTHEVQVPPHRQMQLACSAF